RAEIRAQGENPIPWELGYDPTDVKGALKFVARVIDGTKVIFVSREPAPPAQMIKIFVARPPEPKRKVTGQVVWKPDVVPAGGAQWAGGPGGENTVLGGGGVAVTRPPVAFEVGDGPAAIRPRHRHPGERAPGPGRETGLAGAAVPVITQGKPTDVRIVLLPVAAAKPLLGADVPAAVAAYLKAVPPRMVTATADLDGDGTKDGLAWVEAPGGAGTLFVL